MGVLARFGHVDGPAQPSPAHLDNYSRLPSPGPVGIQPSRNQLAEPDSLFGALGCCYWSGEANQAVVPSAPADLGQEGQRLETHTALRGQEGHARERMYAAAAAGMGVQKYQEKTLAGWPNFSSAGAPAVTEQPTVAAEFQKEQLLFQPGVLEALSGAEADQSADICFTFNAAKTSMQGHQKRKGKKETEECRSGRGI